MSIVQEIESLRSLLNKQGLERAKISVTVKALEEEKEKLEGEMFELTGSKDFNIIDSLISEKENEIRTLINGVNIPEKLL